MTKRIPVSGFLTWRCYVCVFPVAKARILGNREQHVKSGSDVNLTCQVSHDASAIYWYHRGQVVTGNYYQRGPSRVRIETRPTYSRSARDSDTTDVNAALGETLIIGCVMCRRFQAQCRFSIWLINGRYMCYAARDISHCSVMKNSRIEISHKDSGYQNLDPFIAQFLITVHEAKIHVLQRIPLMFESFRRCLCISNLTRKNCSRFDKVIRFVSCLSH